MRRSCSSAGEAGGTNFFPLKNSLHGLAEVHRAETCVFACSVGVARAGTDLDNVVEKVANEASERAKAAGPPPGGAEADGMGAVEVVAMTMGGGDGRTVCVGGKKGEGRRMERGGGMSARDCEVYALPGGQNRLFCGPGTVGNSVDTCCSIERSSGIDRRPLPLIPYSPDAHCSMRTQTRQAMQEDADGFVRTLEPAPDSDFDDAASALEFGSDDDARDAPFFEPQRPAAWDLAGARAEAAKPRPFQTSIDEKIKVQQRGLSNPPKETGTDELKKRKRTGEGEEEGKRRKKGKLMKGSRAEEGDSDSDEGGVVKKKGKKRLRKEKAAAKSFTELHLSRALQKAVEQLEWHEPTPIQSRAIPYILAGRDICGSAVTGSGKTGAFVLPVLERLLQAGVDNVTRVVILLPTRELAAQCHAVIASLAKYTAIRAALAVGGLSNKTQEVALRTRPHILVATPGRLIDHIRNAHGFSLDDIEVLIMDEADRLLEMGFQAEVEEIVRNTRAAGRQTLLFSATMTDDLKGLIKLSLQNPINLAVDPVLDVASTLQQEFVKLKPAFETSKDAVLLALVNRTFKSRTIIFFRQKITAHRFKILFGLTKLKSAELHGNLTQAQRLAALDEFKDGTVDFLLCTDLAARGLDIAGVETVINYDLPVEVKEYVHRVGRTARAGKEGRACSIVCSGNNDERKLLKGIAKRAQGQLSARIVPPSVIGKWRAWIDSLEKAVKAVLKEEKQEKEMRLAEMELSKASNIMQHSDDIYSRPARTWFQNEGQKRESRAKAREEKGLGPSLDDKLRVEKRKQRKAARDKQNRGRESSEREQGYSKQRAEARNAKKKTQRKNKR